MIEYDGITIEWLGHATLRVASDEIVVYTDPGRYGVLDGHDGTDGDVVCITHDHHYDTNGVRTVAAADATVVAFDGINPHRIDRDVERLADLPYDVRRVDVDSDIAVDEAIVRTTAAYNEPDGPHVRENGEPYHPKGLGCGFHLTIDGVSVYCPGDTDVLDGHDRLDVDVFCPPIGGTFTMDRHEAAGLAAALDPGLAVPIHYDTFEAIETDAEAFAEELEERGIDVHLD
ncbi:MAG: MBL fold metallo-hydrolase [Halobacteriota archaeon]|uniref:MBL fold metallo-hydrolase n=1 Tax=Natronomonas sp. TaxID=2184060 RepID=UPI0039747D39